MSARPKTDSGVRVLRRHFDPAELRRQPAKRLLGHEVCVGRCGSVARSIEQCARENQPALRRPDSGESTCGRRRYESVQRMRVVDHHARSAPVLQRRGGLRRELSADHQCGVVSRSRSPGRSSRARTAARAPNPVRPVSRVVQSGGARARSSRQGLARCRDRCSSSRGRVGLFQPFRSLCQSPALALRLRLPGRARDTDRTPCRPRRNGRAPRGWRRRSRAIARAHFRRVHPRRIGSRSRCCPEAYPPRRSMRHATVAEFRRSLGRKTHR